MTAFLALVGADVVSPDNPFLRRAADAARERGWARYGERADTFQVFGSGPALTVGDHGVIVGTCFSRAGSFSSVTRLEPAAVRRAALTGGRSLVQDLWGSFVYIGHQPEPPSTTVLRDPWGGVACYFVRVDGGVVVSTDTHALLRTCGRRATIDWDVVRQLLVYRDIRGAATALAGVEELHPGCTLTTGAMPEAASERGTAWDVRLFADRCGDERPASDLDEKTGELVLACVAAWGRSGARPMLELSGGLDSSAIAAGLFEAGIDFEAITTVSQDLGIDELRWARPVADRVGAKLHVVDIRRDDVSWRRRQASVLPRPLTRSFMQAPDRLHAEVIAASGAQLVLSGGGGDNVFCHLQSAAVVADHVRRHGVGLRGLQVVADAASAARSTWSSVVRHAFRHLRSSRRPDDWSLDLRMLARQEVVDPPHHPWLDGLDGLPPGKRRHVRALVGVQNHLEGLRSARAAPVAFPLLSQPLVEWCLGIPSYRWIEGGRDRAIVRRAMAGRLPRAVVERRGKGGFEGLSDAFYRRNAELLRATLSDGRLVAAGIVDAAAVRKDYSEGSGSDRLRIMALADVEDWVAAWG